MPLFPNLSGHFHITKKNNNLRGAQNIRYTNTKNPDSFGIFKLFVFYKLAFIIKSSISLNPIPAFPAASGIKLVGVIPGIVFVSRMYN